LLTAPVRIDKKNSDLTEAVQQKLDSEKDLLNFFQSHRRVIHFYSLLFFSGRYPITIPCSNIEGQSRYLDEIKRRINGMREKLGLHSLLSKENIKSRLIELESWICFMD